MATLGLRNTIKIIILVIVMTSKLQKLERIKLPPSRGRPEGQLAAPVTQTIIINNPNININYLNDPSKPNGPLSSRGLDSWNLNNNLKEFSQTRQLGFFKHKKDRNHSNSPYIIHKVRTQDLRSVNKIYAPHTNPLKETLTHFRKNQTISHIPQPSMPQQNVAQSQPQTPLEKLMARHDKTVTQKFYQARTKKETHKDYQTLPTHYINATNPEISAPRSFRRDRFELAHPIPLTERKMPSRESRDSGDSREKCVKVEEREEREEREAESGESERKGKQVGPRMLPLSLRRRAFTKTIAKIDQALLNNTDDYFQRFKAEKLPQTKIELLVNSVSHPQQTASESRVQIVNSSGWGVYEFEFEEQRKKRPKTPKRKKQYEQEDQL